MIEEEMLTESLLSAMYEQEDDDDEVREQPIQLRLAGKATVVTLDGQKLPVPRIEYVEGLEKQIREQTKRIEQQEARIKKMEIMLSRVTNIANRRLNAVEEGIKGVKYREY